MKTTLTPPQRTAPRQTFQPTSNAPRQTASRPTTAPYTPTQAPAQAAAEKPRSSGPCLNKVMLIGTLTRDPEIKTTPKGSTLASVSIALNRSYATETGERREEVTYVDIELWGRQAEIAGEFLRKGRPVYIEGRLKLDMWEDKETGQKRSKLRVVGDSLQLLGSREGAAGQPLPPPTREHSQSSRVREEAEALA